MNGRASLNYHTKRDGNTKNPGSSNSAFGEFKIDYHDHLGLWRNKLKQWIPGNIFDAHIHLGRPEFMLKDFSPERLKIALSSFPHMTFEELEKIYSQIYDGKNIKALFAFPFPQFEIDNDTSNRYIIELARLHAPKIKAFLRSEPSDIPGLAKTFSGAEKNGVRIYGIKPYFDLLAKSNFDTKMNEILPEKLLAFMNSEKLILMLHTTGRGLSDNNVIDNLKRITEKYPGIKIILAHMGRYLKKGDFENFMISGLPECENIFLDISFASEKSIYETALSDAGIRKRLLFASDMPFGLITGGEFFSENDNAILITRDKYSWS